MFKREKNIISKNEIWYRDLPKKQAHFIVSKFASIDEKLQNEILKSYLESMLNDC